MTPGSMPPLSKSLAEEGVLIQNLKLLSAGESRFDELRDLLLSGPYPTRNVEANLADVAAQVAANRQGANDLLALVERVLGGPSGNGTWSLFRMRPSRRFGMALSRLRVATHSFTDYLETANGESLPICVQIAVHELSPNPVRLSSPQASPRRGGESSRGDH